MGLLPVLLFGPGLVRLARRYMLGQPVPVRLGIPRKGICLLMAFIMLFGPEQFRQLAEAQTQYANLGVSTWGQVDRTITYEYDDNGSVLTKTTTVTSTTAVVETVTNHYNLVGRLDQVTTEYGDTVEVTEYTYNDEGIRVKSQFTRTISSVNDQTRTTTYLIDPYNHTGYAQTLEEETITTDYISGVPQTPVTQLTTYLIGDDVIAQTKDGDTQYLLYDGHGSTRQLANWTGSDVTITDNYSYDGYGVLLQNNSVASDHPGYTPLQATNLLYAGEHFDADNQNYYLRARWYNPLTGLFNRMDDFAGNSQDPQSLHKYLYCHANPVNGIDPSGASVTFLEGALYILILFLVINIIAIEITKHITSKRIEAEPGEIIIINAGINDAKNNVQNALQKLLNINKTENKKEYEKWFGKYDPNFNLKRNT